MSSISVDQISNSNIMQQLQNMQSQLKVLQESAGTQNAAVANGTEDPEGKYVGGTSKVAQTEEVQAPTAQDAVGLFQQMLTQAFEDVNIQQNETSAMQARFDVGDRSVTLADVMLATNKASISFEATMQIRNKLVDAYQTIYQMSI